MCALVHHVVVESRDLTAVTKLAAVVSHTTMTRPVTLCAPEFEKRWSRFSRSVNRSWRVDETCIVINGKWLYLSRALDIGRTVDFLLRPDGGIAAAQAFFRKAPALHTDHPPLKIIRDGHHRSHRALRLLWRAHAAWRRIRVCNSSRMRAACWLAWMFQVNAVNQLARQRSHGRCPLHQRTVANGQVDTDDAPVTVNQAMRETLDPIRECPRRDRWGNGRQLHSRMRAGAKENHTMRMPMRRTSYLSTWSGACTPNSSTS